MTEKNKMNSKFAFLKLIMFGFIIGIAAVTPGLSGGIMAISFGIYAKLINSITSIHKDFKQSLSFLFPFGIGTVVGIFVFGLTMQPLLENYEKTVIWVFIGLITGSVPALLKEANKDKFKYVHLVPMLITFALGYFLNNITEQSLSILEVTPFVLFIAGGILVLGSIIPGISSSFILLRMGIYDNIISTLTLFNIYSIFWIVLGAVAFFICSINLVNFLFDRFHTYASFAAFGFLISTVFSILPRTFTFWDMILFFVALLSIYFFMNKNSNAS